MVAEFRLHNGLECARFDRGIVVITQAFGKTDRCPLEDFERESMVTRFPQGYAAVHTMLETALPCVGIGSH